MHVVELRFLNAVSFIGDIEFFLEDEALEQIQKLAISIKPERREEIEYLIQKFAHTFIIIVRYIC